MSAHLQSLHTQAPQPMPKVSVGYAAGPGAAPAQPLIGGPTAAPPALASPARPSAAPREPNMRPIGCVFLGPRGSGKSTQARKAAETHNLLFISSGDLVRAGKQPFLELRNILATDYAQGAYRGVALDRFLLTDPTDMYFVEFELRRVGLSLDIVFVLSIDYDVGLARSVARDDKEGNARPRSDQRRMMEFHAIFEASTSLFEPLGKSHIIECDDKPVDAIAAEVTERITSFRASGAPVVYLPEKCLKGLQEVQLVPDYTMFQEVKADVAAALRILPAYKDYFPGSQMTGIFDDSVVARMRGRLPTYYATIKADGQRVLVVKHERGVFLFPSNYQAMYQQNPAPAAHDRAPDELGKVEGISVTKPVSYVVDAEIIAPCDSLTTKKLAIYVFDFLFFFGLLGKSTPFAQRYELIANYFGTRNLLGTYHAKRYVPFPELRTLMAKYGEGQPFPIDGVILQHSGFYTTPRDANVYKWKPREMCTVDYRLCDSDYNEKTKEWRFGVKVSVVREDKTVDEATVEGVVVIIPNAVVEKENLADGSIVECIKSAKKVEGSKLTVWDFHRTRRDKLTPNRKDIADITANLKHITYDQLLSLAESMRPSA